MPLLLPLPLSLPLSCEKIFIDGGFEKAIVARELFQWVLIQRHLALLLAIQHGNHYLGAVEACIATVYQVVSSKQSQLLHESNEFGRIHAPSFRPDHPANMQLHGDQQGEVFAGVDDGVQYLILISFDFRLQKVRVRVQSSQWVQRCPIHELSSFNYLCPHRPYRSSPIL